MAKLRKEIKKQTLKQRQTWYLIRILTGAYLIYLAWQLGSGILSGMAEDNIILLGIAAGVFGLVGVILIILDIRLLLTDKTPDDEDTLPEDKKE